MENAILLGLSATLAIVAWSVIVQVFVWPKLKTQSRTTALKVLIPVHFFRYIGTAFLVTGVVAHKLPTGFSGPAAIGDLIAVALAYIAFGSLQWSRSARVQNFFSWVFNLEGTVDLLTGFALGPILVKNLGDFGATWYLLTVVVPLLYVSHFYIFKVLLSHPSRAR